MIEGKTQRGFPYIKFNDWYGHECSIQISSIADDRCIWFGAHPARMHLSMDQVKELLPILQRFAETGEITEGI